MPEGTTARTLTGRKHRADIDGLRAVAVLSVLAFHTHTPGFGGGYTGVDVFFVLSGYLICSILTRELESGTFHISRFYERRCKRILPALFAVLAFCAVTAMMILSPSEAVHLGRSIAATAFSVSNVHFYLQGSYFDHGGDLNPLLMTWSLAVEEQFYIVFPLLMMLLYRRSRKHLFGAMVLLCAISFGISVWSEFHHPEFNFYLPVTRAWELGAGTLLALVQAQRPVTMLSPQRLQHALSITGMALVLGCVVFYTPGTRFPGMEALPPVLGTLLLIAAPDGVVNRMLSMKAVAAVGLISYSLYLWHWPLLSFASIAVSGPLSATARAELMALAAALAVLSYHFIETPFRSAQYASRGRVLSMYGAALAGFAVVGIAMSMTNGFARRTPQLAKTESALELNRTHDCIVTPDREAIDTPGCVPPVGVSAVVLLGDSHAEALAPTLRSMLQRHGEQLMVITSYSCPPLKNATRFLSDKPEHGAACARFNTRTLEMLSKRTDIQHVVLAGAWSMSNDDKFGAPGMSGDRQRISLQASRRALQQGLVDEVRALEQQGKEVVVIDDVPSLPIAPLQAAREQQLPVRALLAHALGSPVMPAASSLPRRNVVTAEAEDLRNALLEMDRSDAKLKVVDAKSAFCQQSLCSYADGAGLYYTDTNHVSDHGAAKVLQASGLLGMLRTSTFEASNIVR